MLENAIKARRAHQLLPTSADAAAERSSEWMKMQMLMDREDPGVKRIPQA